MAKELYECNFCFTRQKIPFKHREELNFPCKKCGVSINVLHEELPPVSNLKSLLYQAGTQHKFDYGGPWGIPWPVFALITIHHLVLLWEIYSFINEFAQQPQLILEIVSNRLPQILALLLIICGFHFRWKWFWSCIRTITVVIALISLLFTVTSLMWIFSGIKMGPNQFLTLYTFLISLTICTLSFTEYYALGLPSSRAYFGFACPKCNSLLTSISFYNTDDAFCHSCNLKWKLSRPPKIMHKTLGQHANEVTNDN